jgi:dihydroorotase
MLRALKYASMFDTFLAQHCQDNSLGTNGVMNSGYNSTILGLPGIDPLAEEMMLWRDVQLVKKTKTPYHAQHISTKGSAKIIRQAKKENLPVTCEVTPHHLLFTDDAIKEYDTYFKVNPPLRTREDIDALIELIKDGLVDALVTDHAPHLISEKELEFLNAPFGIASLECALPLFHKALIEPGIITWPEMIKMMTRSPADIMKIEKGSLSKGSIADVTIFDPKEKWEIDVDKFFSKSSNCPYNRWKVTSRVKNTIVGGEIRYSDKL